MDDIQRDIQQVEQRVRRYWVEDGLAEILSGLMIALVGAYFCILSVVPPGPRSRSFAHSAFLSW